MTQDEIIEMAREAKLPNSDLYHPNLEAFAKLVADKATEEANARANASWTLMCKKMVAAEREALANYFDAMPGLEMFGSTVADEIREWGQE